MISKWQFILIMTVFFVLGIALLLAHGLVFWELSAHRTRNEQAHYTTNCLLLLPPAPERTAEDVERCQRKARFVHPPP